jgi:hypothetical protein
MFMNQKILSTLLFVSAFCYSTQYAFTQAKDSCIAKPSELLVNSGGHKFIWICRVQVHRW